MEELNFYENEAVYVIDTSSLITLTHYYKRDSRVFRAIWEEIEDLIRARCFRILEFVETEINRYEGKGAFLKEWTKKWRKYFVYKMDNKSVVASQLIINAEFNTGFLDSKKQLTGKEEADPYLLGYCQTNSYTLITNESRFKPNKLPAVAGKCKVNWIDLEKFFRLRGLRMQRKKTVGRFVIEKRIDGEYQFNLKANNEEVILTSEGYSTKAGCKNGIESVRKNSQDDSKYDKKVSSNEKYYFNLTAPNRQVIGTSQMYESESGRDKGIDSVKRNAPDAEVEDRT